MPSNRSARKAQNSENHNFTSLPDSKLEADITPNAQLSSASEQSVMNASRENEVDIPDKGADQATTSADDGNQPIFLGQVPPIASTGPSSDMTERFGGTMKIFSTPVATMRSAKATVTPITQARWHSSTGFSAIVKMPIACHDSCYTMPDVVPGKRPRRKLRAHELKQQTVKRKEEMKGILREARLWTLAITLPNDIISEEQQYPNELNRIASAIFGRDYDEGKIDRFFRRMGMKILSPWMSEEVRPSKTSPEWPRTQLIQRSDDETVPRSVLRDIYKECPDFRLKYREARTWKEVKRCAAPFRYYDYDLRECLEDGQSDRRKYAYGLNERPTAEDMEQIHKMLKSPEKGSLFTQDDSLFLKCDFVSICTDRKAFMNDPPCGTMSQWYNVMGLWPPFFEDATMSKGMEDFRFTAGSDDVRTLFCTGANQTATIIHELAHSRSLLGCKDSVVYLTREEWDDISKRGEPRDREWSHGEVPTDQKENILIAEDDDDLYAEGRYFKAVLTYGLDLAFLLARRYEANGSRKPEDCADSWAIFAMLRILLFVYPDFDFLPFYQHPQEHENPSLDDPWQNDSGYCSRSENGDEKEDTSCEHDRNTNETDNWNGVNLPHSDCVGSNHYDQDHVYPEAGINNDYMEGVCYNNAPENDEDTSDCSKHVEYTVQHRYKLAHHWTGLDCLRNPNYGSIRNHWSYDSSKDSWAQKFGNKKFTIEETLDIVLKNVEYFTTEEDLATEKIELKEKLRNARSSHEQKGPFAAASEWCDSKFPPFDFAEILNLEKADWLKDILSRVSELAGERPGQRNTGQADEPWVDTRQFGGSSDPCASSDPYASGW